MISILVLLPLLGAAAALLAATIHRPRLAYAAGFLSLAATLVAASCWRSCLAGGGAIHESVGGWSEPLGIGLTLDGLGWIGIIVLVGISLFIYGHIVAEGHSPPSVVFFFLLAVAGMVGLILADDIFNMFVMFEILSLASYLLIAVKGSGRAFYASLRYLILSTVGMTFFLLGIFVLYRETGVLSLSLIAEAIRARGATPGIAVAAAAILAGIGTRAAFFPFHGWLAEAHSQAPHPISALLSGVLLNSGWFVMVRMMPIFPLLSLSTIFEVLGPFTAFFGACGALLVTDKKKILAMSSIAQMGILLTAFAGMGGTELQDSLLAAAALYQMMSHALAKSLLFLSLGILFSAEGPCPIRSFRELFRQMPLLSLCICVGVLSLVGLPLFGGFPGKRVISEAAGDSPFSSFLGGASVATVAAFLRWCFLLWNASPHRRVDRQDERGNLFGERDAKRNTTAPHRIAEEERGDQEANLSEKGEITEGACCRNPKEKGWFSTWGIFLPSLFLACGCLLVGWMPRLGLAVFTSFLGLRLESEEIPPLFAPAALLETMGILMGGVVLWRVTLQPRVEAALDRFRRRFFGLDSATLAVMGGFVALAAFLWRWPIPP